MYDLNNIRVRIVDIKELPGYRRIIIKCRNKRGGIQIPVKGDARGIKARLNEWSKNQDEIEKEYRNGC